MGLHLRHERFAELIQDPRLLVPARQLLGDVKIYAQQVKVNAEEAFTGEQWQWHYDFATHHHEDGVPDLLDLDADGALDAYCPTSATTRCWSTEMAPSPVEGAVEIPGNRPVRRAIAAAAQITIEVFNC